MNDQTCSHASIARCEQTIPWCTDCHQYIDQQTGKPSTAPTLQAANAIGAGMSRAPSLARDGKPYFKQSSATVEPLGWDSDTESWQYREDIES